MSATPHGQSDTIVPGQHLPPTSGAQGEEGDGKKQGPEDVAEPQNGFHLCVSKPHDRDHFVEEHMHRQVRWSKAALNDLKLKGGSHGSYTSPEVEVASMMQAPNHLEADMLRQLYMQESGASGGFMQEQCHTHMRWSCDAQAPRNGGEELCHSALPFDLQMNGSTHSVNGVQEDTQTHVHFEKDADQEMCLEVDWHRHTRWPKDKQSPEVSANGLKHDMEEADSQHYVEEYLHRQLRWSRTAFDGRRPNGECNGAHGGPINGSNGGLHTDRQNQEATRQKQIEWLRNALGHADDADNRNGFHRGKPKEGRNGHRDVATPLTPAVVSKAVLSKQNSHSQIGYAGPPQGADEELTVELCHQALEFCRMSGQKPPPAAKVTNGHHRSNGKVAKWPALTNGAAAAEQFHDHRESPEPHESPVLNGEGPPARNHVTENGSREELVPHLNGSKSASQPPMQWSPRAYEQLLLNAQTNPFKGFTMQGIRHPFNGVCNDLRLQVDGMRALQDHLTQLQEGQGRGLRNGAHRAPHINGMQIEGKRSVGDPPPNGAHGIESSPPEQDPPKPPHLNGHHKPTPVHLNGFKGHQDSSPIKLNGLHHPSILRVGTEVTNQDVGVGPDEPHTATMSPPPPVPWSAKANGHIVALPPDLVMQGILHPRQSKRYQEGGDMPGSDEDEPRLNGELHDPRADALAHRCPSSLKAAIHAPCHAKGTEPRPEAQPWWSAEAFNGLPLTADPATPSAETVPLTKVSADPQLPAGSGCQGHTAEEVGVQQQLLLSQAIIQDLMRENADMRLQIEESESREKRWRREKERLQKELLFQRTSISTLQDANAHLQHEVDELRVLGDHLLSHIKHKMKNGLTPRQLGVS